MLQHFCRGRPSIPKGRPRTSKRDNRDRCELPCSQEEQVKGV